MESNYSAPNEEQRKLMNALIGANDYYTVVVPRISPDNMKFAIGKSGKWFKWLTEQAGVSYVWYDSEKNQVQVYGPERQLAKFRKLYCRHEAHTLGVRVKPFGHPMTEAEEEIVAKEFKTRAELRV